MAFNVGAVVAEVTADISNFKKGMGEVEGRVQGVGKTIQRVGSGVADFGKKAAIFTGVLTAGLGVATKKAIDMAGEFEQSEIAFTTLLKDRGKAIEAIKEIEKEAKATPYNLPDLIKANQLLISAGVNTSDARDQIRDLGNAIAATGGGTAELNRLAVNLQQIKAVGKASALDIKQFAFAGINVYDMLAKSTGKTVEQVREMDITYDMLTESFAQASAEGGVFEGAMEAQSKSLQGLISNLQDVIGITLKDIAMDSGIFEIVKNAVGGIVSFLEANGDRITEFFRTIGTAISLFSEVFTDFDIGAWLSEEDYQKFLPMIEIFRSLQDIFSKIAKWISENQELVLTFLKGLGIALGVLVIVGTITALLGALLNPITLVALAIAGLYTAWQTNFMGIRDIVNNVVNWIVNFWNEYLHPAIQKLADWFSENSDSIISILSGAWEIIKGVIQVAWGIVSGILKVGLALLSGDWGKAWQGIKETASTVWDGIKKIFNGAIEFLSGWGGIIFKKITEPFERAWGKVQELVNKIKDKLDMTHRESPSILDVVQRGVSKVNRALDDLAWSADITPRMAGATLVNQGASPAMGNVYVDMSGAMVGDLQQADEIGERIGDSIMRRLKANVRL